MILADKHAIEKTNAQSKDDQRLMILIDKNITEEKTDAQIEDSRRLMILILGIVLQSQSSIC